MNASNIASVCSTRGHPPGEITAIPGFHAIFRTLISVGRHIFLILFFLCMSLGAQSQSWWAKFQGGANVDETLGVASDASGNVYMTGYFSTSAEVNGQMVSVNGLTDMFLSKVNASGNTVWSVSAGGPQSDRGLGVAVDNSGNVFVCGFFSGTANFGNGVSLSAAGGGQDAFLAKYNSLGQVQWARAGGSSAGADRANAVAVDASGNAVITGQFTGEANFGAYSLTSTNSTNDIFVVKYGADGTEQWAKSGTGDALNRGLAIATDANGGVYAAGQFSGDITFDNTYSNNILNALFLVKYDAAGNEQWVRWAGGGNQSIAYGLASDGNNVYLTGDCGSSLTFFGASTNSQISAQYNNAIFVAGYSGAGQFLWGSTQSSTSPVSSRAISRQGNKLAIGGWHECTFTTMSEHFGEAYFNSIGFRDAFAMRYTTSGSFVTARNFGSQSGEEVYGITLPPDDKEIVVGMFTDDLIIPKSGAVSGLSNIFTAPNFSSTYCGDDSYGDFGLMTGIGNRDGFAVKAIDYDRAPYDYYVRFGNGCDTDIPGACIVPGSPYPVAECSEEISGCAPIKLSAVNQTVFQIFENKPSIVGFDYSVLWSPSGSPGVTTYATNPGTYTATFTSEDGCYVKTAEVDIVIGDQPPTPLMSDSEGVNNQSFSTSIVHLCPGETVDIWSTFPDGYDFTWSGPGLTPDQTTADIITISNSGTYQITLTNEEGCTSSNFIMVWYYPQPPDEIQPYMIFPAAVDDTIRLCKSSQTSIMILDSLTDVLVPAGVFGWTWTASPNFSLITGESQVSVSPPVSGWYEFTVNIFVEDNPCFENISYIVSDSVYVYVMELPEIFVNLTGPAMACFGDTLTLFLEYQGNLELMFTPIADFGDSLWVDGAGGYSATVDSTDAITGCYNSKSSFVNIAPAASPEIFSNPPSAVICPGDSVQLITPAQGTITWQGPSGGELGGQSIFVSDPGLYFAEVVFYSGCGLVSNTIQVSEYNTPFIAGSSAFLCPGDTMVITVMSTALDDLIWLPPFSGSDTSQYVTEPGIYTAEVTGCGITTQVSIEVEMSTDSLFIHRPDLTRKCEGDSVLIVATSGYTDYQWMPTGQGDSIYVHQNAYVQAFAVTEDGCELESNGLDMVFEPIPPEPDFEFSLVCEGDDFFLNVLGGPYETVFTDGFDGEILQTDPQVVLPSFSTDTVFYVYLSSQYCRGLTDSLYMSPKPYPPEPLPLSDAPVCLGTYLHLLIINDSADVNYIWTTPTGAGFSGSEVDHYVTSMDEAGVYSVYADLQGCLSDTVLLEVDLFDTQWAELPPDTISCEQTGFVISPVGSFDAYEWQDGSTDSLYMAIETGQYVLTATDANGCKSTDVIYLELYDCSVEIPNIITVNGDGMNDVWWIDIALPGYFEATVYNRWGRIVYESNDHLQFWDGVNQSTGEPCSEGVYFYIVKLRNLEGRDFELTGPLTLVRE